MNPESKKADAERPISVISVTLHRLSDDAYSATACCGEVKYTLRMRNPRDAASGAVWAVVDRLTEVNPQALQ